MKKLFYRFLLFFKGLYVSWLKWRTMKLIAKTTKSVTKLLPHLGKDPNYVPPPPPPPKPPTPIDETRAAWIVDTKERPAKMADFGSYEPWVKNPTDHPVLRARKLFEEKQAKAEAAKAAREAAREAGDPPMVTNTTEVGGEAIDSLREAIHQVEGLVLESDKKEE